MDGPSRARARARAREIIEEFRPGSKLRETIFFLAVSLTRTWGSALGLVAAAYWAGEPARVRYAIGRDGRHYLTASPHLAEPNLPTKDRWWEDVETDRPQTALPLGHPLRG